MMDISCPRVAKPTDLNESQRALELRKFFTPPRHSTQEDNDFHASLDNDGALSAYAETVVWRLRGVHAMVSLLDNGIQYFLAGAIRSGADQEDEDDVSTNGVWFGCETVPTPGGLCENTLKLDLSENQYPCFIVNDLSKDPRFSNLPVVNGAITSYRFYAGTPITTSHNVNIGSFFIFDDKVRDGLSLAHRKFLHQQAANVMKHLETKREAAERRRVALMSKGMADFLERTCHSHDLNHKSSRVLGGADTPRDGLLPRIQELDEAVTPDSESISEPEITVLDKIRMTLDHAANIIQESLELTAGGIVFLDTTVGYTENDIVESTTSPEVKPNGARILTENLGLLAQQASSEDTLRPSYTDGSVGRHLSQGTIRSSTDKHKPCKVLAQAAVPTATWDSQSSGLDAKTLQGFINSYPKGTIWYIDGDGYFSSLDQTNDTGNSVVVSPSGRTEFIGTAKQKAEATILSGIFHRARQIIFLPLWDAGADRWYSGCFVWSQLDSPIFTQEAEVAYLSAFTNSMMVEISRLDAITANKVKSDFISSISHEFRSPLHGILASVEFLRDSALDSSQIEFISTIQNCGGTLLDTINHVLDYSKINSFEKLGNKQGTTSNELFQKTNLALLCEDVLNGMIAANEYHAPSQDETSSIPPKDIASLIHAQIQQPNRAPLDIIIDIENRAWEFWIQGGALRRVVMNIFGNAQKYTQTGYIMVQLRVQDTPEDTSPYTMKSSSKSFFLRIRDTGRGMSSEYMERKLYHPFAQEDSFAPGVGLGLSIVWNIVNQLGGKIHIRSELGKGTDVEVTIPLDVNESSEVTPTALDDPAEPSLDAQNSILALRQRALGMSVCIQRSASNHDSAHLDSMSWACVERYCSQWFGFEILPSDADIVITDTCNPANYSDEQRILICSGMPCPGKPEKSRPVGHISTPIGPFKLARSILALLDMDISATKPLFSSRKSDAGTQTPIGSPEELKVLNGIIATDYGFPSHSTHTSMPSSDSSTQDPQSPLPPPDTNTPLSPPTPRLTPPPPPQRFPLPPPSVTQSSLILPIRRPQTKPPTQILQAAPKGLHILAVDDNAINLQLLSRFLQKSRLHTIVLARDGREAVAAFKAAVEPFDVVFMDISMPEMDGFEATRLIRDFENARDRGLKGGGGETVDEVEVKRKAHIVALTGLASRRDRDEAEQSGFDGFLTKPVGFRDIGEVIALVEKMTG